MGIFSMPQSTAYGILNNASNIKGGTNPPFSVADFLGFYPQFQLVQTFVIEEYITVANSYINASRWRAGWKDAMRLYVAHKLALYLKTFMPEDNPLAENVYNAGLAQGLQTGASVGDVSYSTDYSIAANEFDGWGDLNLTVYGQQLATRAKIVGMGAMGVY